MSTVKQLQAERGPIGRHIRTLADRIHDDKRDFTAEERGEWDRVNADFDRLTRRIEEARAEEESVAARGRRDDDRPAPGSPAARAAEVESILGRGHPNPPGAEDTYPGEGFGRRADRRGGGRDHDAAEQVRALAFQAWFRRQSGLSLSDRHRRACKLAGINPAARNLDFDLPRRPATSKRALSAVTGSAGGFTVPAGFVATLEKALKDYSGPRQVADVIRTDGGAPMSWPTVNDTGNVGRIVGEGAAVNQLDPTFGQVTFGAFKYTSDLVLVPAELLDDSAVDMGKELGEILGERIGRIQEQHFTTGTGTGQPQGIVTGAGLGKTAASATLLTGDEIIDLIHSVDPAYRADPSFRLMFSDGILAILRKLKDGQGRPLFEEGQDGFPDKVKGVRFVINQNMPQAPATGLRTMLAGPMRKYKVRDVKKVRIKRLDERFADTDQVGFVAFLRSDAKVLNAGTGPIKFLQQA